MFHLEYAEIFSSLPPELATFLIALFPIAELRVALPLALTVFDLPTASAFFWSILGNIIPVIILLYALEPVSKWLEKHSKLGNRFFTWMAHRTEKKFKKNSTKYGSTIALILFVAVPLPITGAWTGTLAAYLFGIKRKRAFLSVFLGVLIASIIVYSITKGIISFS